MVFGICAGGFCTEEVVWLESGIGVVLFTMMVVIVLGCAVSLYMGKKGGCGECGVGVLVQPTG